MNSCLYSCKVGHSRKRPKKHSFSYRVFMFMLDLDELESLSGKLLFLSHNRFNIYSYRDSDHFTQGKATPRDNVEAFVPMTLPNLSVAFSCLPTCVPGAMHSTRFHFIL
jgi:uncharacterized protein